MPTPEELAEVFMDALYETDPILTKRIHDDAVEMACEADQKVLKIMSELMEDYTIVLSTRHNIPMPVARGILSHGLEHALQEADISLAGMHLADEVEKAVNNGE